MRALGFYATEFEMQDMINEIKFARFIETGQYVTEIDLEDIIKGLLFPVLVFLPY